MDPYPAETARDHSLAEFLEQFDVLNVAQASCTLAGRIRAIRGQGGLVFLSIDDGEGSVQGMLKKEHMDAALFDLFTEAVDVGDFVALTGVPFTTKRGERSILASSWHILSKSLLPLPDKWHGLADVEERFRKRYLDTLASPEVKERFISRSRIVSAIRAFLDARGYLEVETPVLQPLYGGASAKPFTTHHNALDTDFYLRISDELYLKRLLVGGFPKIYEIAKNFRNEGIDVTHNPEFTMIEWYEAYADAAYQRGLVEALVRHLAVDILQTPAIPHDDGAIDMTAPFVVVTYADLFARHADLPDIGAMDREALADAARERHVGVAESDGREKILDNIYKKHCRPKLIAPTFIIDYPSAMLPLAKKKAGEAGVVDAFQLVVGGVELVKAFSELNDPLDQRARFEAQMKMAKAGDDEAQQLDEEYLTAMEHGMPPAGGVGIGIDRLVMLLTNTKNIREVILFPTLRPKGNLS